jgi:hypothetical protein
VEQESENVMKGKEGEECKSAKIPRKHAHTAWSLTALMLMPEITRKHTFFYQSILLAQS